MKRVIRVAIFSTLLGFLLLGVSALATSKPWATSGFPFAYSFPNPPTCGSINPLNGCGYSYDPVLVILDYLFWLTIAIIGVTAVDFGWNRIVSRTPRDKKEQPKQSIFG